MYKVRNFSYNGLYCFDLKGLAKYQATFKHWTADPKVCKAVCTDGKERLIPIDCILGLNVNTLPPQNIRKRVIYGTPSHS